MLYLTIITANVLSLFFQIYNVKSVENKHSFFAFRFALRTLMCHLTEMKHDTIHLLPFTQLKSQNTSLSRVNANFKRMEITKFINKLTTNLYIVTGHHLDNKQLLMTEILSIGQDTVVLSQ